MELTTDTSELSAADRVFSSLRHDILALELRPGDLLQERQIAETFGLSRTPVREALQRLERDGLVKIVPRLGAYVVPISFDDIREIYQLRLLLEPAAIGWAVDRLDPDALREMRRALENLPESNLSPAQRETLAGLDFDFHEMVLSAAGNTRLQSFVRNLNAQGLRVRRLAVDHRPDHSRNDIIHMIEAVLDGDADQASQLMREHILWSVRYLQNLVTLGLANQPQAVP